MIENAITQRRYKEKQRVCSMSPIPDRKSKHLWDRDSEENLNAENGTFETRSASWMQQNATLNTIEIWNVEAALVLVFESEEFKDNQRIISFKFSTLNGAPLIMFVFCVL